MNCTTSTSTGISLHQRHKRFRSGSQSQRSEPRNTMDLVHWLGDLQQRWSTWRSSSATQVPSQIETESTGTGQDMWSSDGGNNQGHLAEHLVIMVNGLNGSPDDWKFAAEELIKRFPDKVIVHRSQANTAKLTYDGVDRMGERLAEEVRSVIEKRPGVRKISFVAHSLGGLIARYAIAVLYVPEMVSNRSSDEELRPKDTVAGLEPINFITSATPHLGSRGNKQLPYLFGIPFLEKMAVGTAHRIIGRTGKHLFLTDEDDGKPPLLVRMTEDQDDLKFISALGAFKRRVAYANAGYDYIVGWRTSSFRRPHELPKQLSCPSDDKYPNIVNVENGNVDNRKKVENEVVPQSDDFEEKMIRGLTQVPWERVDVRIQKSRLRFNAHNTIQNGLVPMSSDSIRAMNLTRTHTSSPIKSQLEDTVNSQQDKRGDKHNSK